MKKREASMLDCWQWMGKNVLLHRRSGRLHRHFFFRTDEMFEASETLLTALLARLHRTISFTLLFPKKASICAS
jgi:hypothetical protein